MDIEKVEYWRKRMIDRWDQFTRGYQFHFAEMLKNGVHAGLEKDDIEKAVQEVEGGLVHLQAAIKNAKVKEGK